MQRLRDTVQKQKTDERYGSLERPVIAGGEELSFVITSCAVDNGESISKSSLVLILFLKQKMRGGCGRSRACLSLSPP